MVSIFLFIIIMETEAGLEMRVFYKNKKLGRSNIGVTWKTGHGLKGLDRILGDVCVNR
jgi:hypothetical protein